MRLFIAADISSVLVRTVVFVIVFHGFFLIGLPWWIVTVLAKGSWAPSAPWFSWTGAALIALGLAAYFLTVYNFVFKGQGTPAAWDSPIVFVRQGLYRYTRNPMYVSMVIILIGETFWTAQALLFLYAVLLWAGFHLFVIFQEEPALTRRFGKAYEEYRQQVRRWL